MPVPPRWIASLLQNREDSTSGVPATVSYVHISCNEEIAINIISSINIDISREIHPLDLQRHRHSMLVPKVCAPQVTWCSLGKYWSRDFFQQAANPGVHRLSMTHMVGGSEI